MRNAPFRRAARPGPLLALLFFALLLSSLATPHAHAQTATVRGFVTDASDGQPLPGVNVSLRGPNDALYGAAADNDGFYAISRVPAGRYELNGTFIGYQTYVDTLSLAAGQIITLNFALETGAAEMGEVVVEEERETAGAAAISAGLQTIRPSDIELVPTPDVSGDLVTYLQTLPGVVTTGDQGGQLFIRGGEPTQNLVMIDGMLLYQPFHLVGFYSAFPSDIINSTDVYAGGYGGRYGGRLSSVIDVQTRNGNKRQLAGAVSVAPFMSTARLEGPLWKDRISFLFSGRLSVIEEGASKLIDEPLPFKFDDQFAKLHAIVSSNSQLSLSGIRTYDRGVIGQTIVQEGVDLTDQVVWNNQALGGRYIFLPATLPIFAELLGSFSKVENTFGPETEPTRSSSAQQYNVAANITHYLGSTDVNWGLFLTSSTLESELGGQFQNVRAEREFITEVGAYLEPEFSFASGLRVQPGVRVHSFPSLSSTFIEPRVRAVWNFGIHRVSAAWGIYHQQVSGLNDRRDAGDVFTAWTPAPLTQVPQATHYIAGYHAQPTPWLDFSIEGFYKTLSDLAIPEWTAFPRFTTTLQPADGKVYGADIRLEVTTRPFYGFISYGLAEVEYEARGEAIAVWYGTTAQNFNPPHDRRHQVNALGSFRFYDFDLNLRWQFGSGLPFSESLGFDEFLLIDGPSDVTARPGRLRVLYGPPYEGRLPTYHRFDVTLEREFDVTNRLGVTLLAGLINAYDRANLFYLDLFTLRRVDQLPLIPSFGLKVAIK